MGDRVRLGWLVLVAGAGALTAGCDQTPDKSGAYPDGDIKLIVPAGAGDITDTVARAVAPCLGDRLGVDVTVQNRPARTVCSATAPSSTRRRMGTRS